MAAKNFVLMETSVAGVMHHVDRTGLEAVVPGDKLTLVREPDNTFDKHAVRIDLGRKKIGYVPAVSVRPIAALMDGGYKIEAEVVNVVPQKGQVTCRLVMGKN